jgi:hypothetical protein
MNAAENLTPIGVKPKNSLPAKTAEGYPPRPCVTRYLRAIGALALETADRPELLSDFLRIIEVTPRTIETLWSERRRAA